MSTTETRPTEGAIWGRLLDPEKPTLSPEAARSLLALDFPEADKARMRVLAAKARSGNLSPEDQEEIDTYGRVGSLLSILKSKARVSLKKAAHGNGSDSYDRDGDLQDLVWQRAHFRCEYCQMPQEHDAVAFEIDHVIAVSHGGPTRASNLALACFLDNCYQGPNLAGLDPVTRRVTPLFNPRRHKWGRHFRWNGPLLEGRTAIGRATLAVLRINLPHRVTHRAALIEEGVFPPSGRVAERGVIS